MSPEKRNLLIILGALCSLAIVLAVLVIINFVKQPAEVASDEDWEETALYWDGMSDEEYAEAQMIEEFERINTEAKKLLEKNPIDVDAINALYNGGIELAKKNNRPDYIISLNLERRDNFMSKGLTKEALDAMLTMNFNDYSEPDQYRLYSKVIELAESIGDNEVASKYKTLRTGVEQAYLEDYEATKSAAAMDDNIDPEVEEE